MISKFRRRNGVHSNRPRTHGPGASCDPPVTGQGEGTAAAPKGYYNQLRELWAGGRFTARHTVRGWFSGDDVNAPLNGDQHIHGDIHVDVACSASSHPSPFSTCLFWDLPCRQHR